ncbi:hypothetical protein BDV28DRAFT_126885 [Aspergillus coremiiformis]|uniref:Uncharacterized protein n=1 Tax=Aspergillus coremiiformis TaxID=138285 RepID=A0A5N6ZGG2_9EURO|nr:hypothetical protein BDV28DRAFT_126885 [Aspergillus coremiiformis]
MYERAVFFLSSRLFLSFSTCCTRLFFSTQTSFRVSSSTAASSIGVLYFEVPMISSRYSRSPSSCSLAAFGFI